MAGKDEVFIVADGELSLAVTLPSSNTHSGNSKGFLVNKVSGDIVNKGDAEDAAKRRVSSSKLQTFVEGVETVAKVSILVTSTSLYRARHLPKPYLLLQVDTKLMQLDMDKYKDFLEKNFQLKEQIEAIIHSNISDFLSPLPFLKGIKETQRSMLAAMCKYEALSEGQDLFREGDEGDKVRTHFVSQVSSVD